ncbi:MAG: hypothetical protein R2748_12810 [Bryobacterales bacterium]
MDYLIGLILGLTVSGSATLIGLDRSRAFYPTVLIVVASYYALFAAMGASNDTLGMEALMGLGFSFLAVLGFKKSMWLVAAALVGHGVFDVFLHHLWIENPGMPIWWPGFCAGADVSLGAWLAFRLLKGPVLT